MSTKPTVRDDEDDLDELDDIVEQFDTKPSKPQPTTKVASSSTSTTVVTDASGSSTISSTTASATVTAPEELPEDLAKQLAADMENLMRELAEGADGPPEEQRKRQEAWEKLLVDGMDGVDLGEGAGPSPEGDAADAFQKSIQQAMEKLRDSDSTLHTDAAASVASSDPFETLLRQLGSGLEEPGEDSEELQGMLETMMRQLMSKEVLYEPLKELQEKFPAYISENASTLSSEDKTRYENQLDRVSKIIAIFEEPSYRDDDPVKGGEVVALMNEMQSFGSPPSEVMGPLPAGLDFGPDGTPKLPDGCLIS